MIAKKQLLTILWIVIGILAVASVICLLFLPKWKGIFLAGCGGFLVFNLLISIFFIRNNYRNKK